MKYKRILFFLILSLGISRVNGQTPGQNELISKIYDSFVPEDLDTWLPDSSMVIGVALIIEVEKKADEPTSVKSIKITGDDIGKKLVPDSNSLKALDYSAFLGSRKRAKLVLPVIIEMTGSKGITPGRRLDPLDKIRYSHDQDLSNFIFIPPPTILYDRVVKS